MNHRRRASHPNLIVVLVQLAILPHQVEEDVLQGCAVDFVAADPSIPFLVFQPGQNLLNDVGIFRLQSKRDRMEGQIRNDGLRGMSLDGRHKIFMGSRSDRLLRFRLALIKLDGDVISLTERGLEGYGRSFSEKFPGCCKNSDMITQ